MNTQQLESFLAVAENLNFARAAEALNITQSAVSRQIHALENELGAKLFHRTSRSVSLTPTGIAFYEEAKKFMGGLQTAMEKIKNNSEANIQILRIGFGNPAACESTAGLLKKFRLRFPELHPFLRIIPHRSIVGLLFQGDIDIMFGFKDDVPTRKGIAYKELSRRPVCCTISSAHPLAKKKEIREDDLYPEKIIVCNSYSIPSQAAYMQQQMKNQFPLDSVYFCDSLEALLTLIRAGYGFGILPETNLNDPEIASIPFEDGECISYGIFYNEQPPNPLIKKFLSILK